MTACATADEDAWTPPISGGGKADGVQLISGADIPSPHVDPNKRYIASRLYEPLHQIGAIGDAALITAQQCDGLVDQRNARIDVAELVRCEQTHNPFAGSTPELWRALEAPDRPVMRVDGLPSTLIETRVTPTEAVALVPPLGPTSTVAHIGGIDLKCESSIAVTESRSLFVETGPDPWGGGWSGGIDLHSDVSISLQVDSRDKVLFLDLDRWGYEETVSGPDGSVAGIFGGAYIVERYRDGVRQESHAIVMPIVGSGVKRRYPQYLDYTIATPTGPLVKNVEHTELVHGQYNVTFTYATSAVSPSANDQAALDAVSTPVSLPPGHYVVPIAGLGTYELDLYPSGLILSQGERWGWWLTGSPQTKTLELDGDHTSLQFVPATNELRSLVYGTTSPTPVKSGSVIVTPAMRI